MIVPLLSGGVGNQLFQIAACYIFAQIYNTTLAINYNMFTGHGQGNSPDYYRDTLYKNIDITDIVPSLRYDNYTYNWILPNISEDDILIGGLYQNPKYIQDYKDIDKIRNLINFDNNPNYIVEDDAIIVHIRRGDYLHYGNFYNILSLDYYISAIKLIPNWEERPIHIATDDPAFLYSLKSRGIEYSLIDVKRDDDLLYCMTKGEYYIGSASTFGWFAAFLGNHKRKFFPSPWFGPEGPRISHDMVLREWISLEY